MVVKPAVSQTALGVLVEERYGTRVLVNLNLDVLQAVLYGCGQRVETCFKGRGLVVDGLYYLIGLGNYCCVEELACGVDLQAQKFAVGVHSCDNLCAVVVNSGLEGCYALSHGVALVVYHVDEGISRCQDLSGDELACGVNLQTEDLTVLVHGKHDGLALGRNLGCEGGHLCA